MMKPGVGKELDKEIDALQFSLSGKSSTRFAAMYCWEAFDGGYSGVES